MANPTSIRGLLTALVLAVAAPLLGATIYFGYRAQAIELDRAEQDLLDVGRAAQTGILQFLTYTERLLEGLSADPHIHALDESCALHFSDLQYQFNPVLLGLDLWSADGSVLCSTVSHQGPDLNLLGTDSFDEALSTDGFRVSSMFQEQRTQRWSTALTYPVVGEDGRRGMLSAVVDLVRFQEILLALDLPDEVLVTVTENEGYVVARSRDPEQWVGRGTSGARVYEADEVTGSGLSRATTLEGTDFSWGFLEVPKSPWVVYVGVPTDVMLAPVREQRLRVALIGLLVLVAAVVAGLSVHRRITGPLEALVAGIESGGGGAAQRLPTVGPREIASVASRFNDARDEVDRLQAQVSAIEKMEALGRLAGGIAHDFNNLLTVVQGHAELLGLDPTLSEQQRQQIVEIMEASERGAALNRQLLAFGRGTPGDPVALDPNEVIRGMEMILRRALGEKVHLILDLAADAPILADRSQVEQVVLNLILNAGDAMPDGGEVHVRTFESEVTPAEVRERPDAQPGPHVVLEVEDDGSGIPDDVLQYVFEPFFSTKEETKGTGLGLATVYGVVANAGGHIRIRTESGVGTTFQVLLPRREGAADSPGATRRVKRGVAASGDVLLVEDDDGVRSLVEKVLRGAGYSVTSVPDGEEALRAASARDEPFALLVSDIVMPGASGVEVARRLAEGGMVDRAVFISGYPEGLAAQGPDGLEEWAFLAKPFSSEQLLGAVENVLAR